MELNILIRLKPALFIAISSKFLERFPIEKKHARRIVTGRIIVVIYGILYV
jgi:hypothetical protein